jgi:ABC-type branched-subunit amino acid transport system substrate-binding protein
MGLTPLKSLRAHAIVLNRTVEQDAAWVRQVEAAKGRLRQRQEPADATVVTGTDPAMEGSELAEMVAPSAVEAGPRSSATAEAAIEVTTGEAPVRGVERAGADVTMEEVASVSG